MQCYGNDLKGLIAASKRVIGDARAGSAASGKCPFLETQLVKAQQNDQTQMNAPFKKSDVFGEEEWTKKEIDGQDLVTSKLREIYKQRHKRCNDWSVIVR